MGLKDSEFVYDHQKNFRFSLYTYLHIYSYLHFLIYTQLLILIYTYLFMFFLYYYMELDKLLKYREYRNYDEIF